MGVDAMRIGVQIRRFLFISIRACYKSVCKHPFVVGFVFFLIFLYRSFPILFSLLVSASPVLVCTAILLGTLLSFGEPNLPEIEIEKDEEITHEVSSLNRSVVSDSTVVFEKDGGFFVENLVGRRKDETGEGSGEEHWEVNGVSKIKRDDDLGDYMPLIDEHSRAIHFGKQINEVGRDFDVLELMKKREIYEEKPDEEVVSNGKAAENGRLQVEDRKSTGESVQNGKGDHDHDYGDDGDDDDDDDDVEASDSGSDGAESSSPDASMTDIIPMLDELHPLLYERTPQPAKESDIESENDTEKANGEEDDENDNEEEEEEEEEEGQKGKDDAIKWTEDDQKNLMDLGTSELERNQRLESLIARRRARSNLKLLAEKNLIDLDGADFLPHNIQPISTRRNPFDFSFDSIDDAPGSAPSILLPRRNPFDIPYDSSEEKPHLKADSFQQFSPAPHRDTIFRRHESFSVGPSSLGGPRQDLRWRPYFVPERYGTEETSYNTFQRQLSGASDSKLSSVPDTESVSSAMEEEDKKLNEDVSNLDHSSVMVERGSLSSDGHDDLDLEDEVINVHHNGDEIVENLQEFSSLSTLGGATPIEVNTTEILLKMEPGEDEYSSRSSVSSLSEIDEKIPDVKKDELHEESQISTQISIDSNSEDTPVIEPISNGTTEAVSVQHKEPVYDSSPQAVEELISFTSEAQEETADIGLAADSAELTAKESEIVAESIEKDGSEECSIDENESRSEEIGGLVDDDRTCSGQNGNPEPDTVDVHLSSSNKGSESEVQENCSVQLDKQLSWSDKSMLEPSLSNREVFLDACTSMKESREEVDESDLKESILDKMIYEDSGHILEECPDYPEETEENISEFEDAIKGIDEGLLSELDTVGDFSVNKAVDESFQNGQIKTEVPVAEEGSSSSITELPVLEIRSVNDIDLAFKQLSQGVEVQDVILSSTIEQKTFDLKEETLEDFHNELKQTAEENAEHLSDGQPEANGVEHTESNNPNPNPSAVKFVRFTVVATEEGIIQKTEEESGDEENTMKTPRESFDETALSLDDTKDDETPRESFDETAVSSESTKDKKTHESFEETAVSSEDTKDEKPHETFEETAVSSEDTKDEKPRESFDETAVSLEGRKDEKPLENEKPAEDEKP